MQQVNNAKLQQKPSSLEKELGKTITGYRIISPYQAWRFLPEKKVSLASLFDSMTHLKEVQCMFACSTQYT